MELIFKEIVTEEDAARYRNYVETSKKMILIAAENIAKRELEEQKNVQNVKKDSDEKIEL